MSSLRGMFKQLERSGQALPSMVSPTTVSLDADDVGALLARARAAARFPDLSFSDPAAEELARKLGVEALVFDERRLRVATLLTMVVDALVRAFFEKHPDGLAIAIHPGLCTRFERLDNGSLGWIEVDTPEIAALKGEVFPVRGGRVVRARAAQASLRWMDSLVGAQDVPIILVAQGLLARLTDAESEAFLEQASRRFPVGTELVFDYGAFRPVRPSRLSWARACVEVPRGDGSSALYPRLRLVPDDEYALDTGQRLRGLNGVSRLFRGRSVPSVAHVRLV